MKKVLFLSILFIICLLAYLFIDFWWQDNFSLVSPLSRFRSTTQEPKSYSLNKYSFEALREREFIGSQISKACCSAIKLEKVIKKEEKFTAYLFSFETEGKKVTGQANLPAGRQVSPDQKFPVVVMLRGQVDDEVYFTGAGTYKAAGVFAENGFVTLAPDFLGFGGSQTSSSDILEARFERPVTVLSLLASVGTLEQVNPEKIVLWGHSNGGQIALSVLEITKKPIPTTLWAPVTKGFPESVLTYMGEMDDQGLKVKSAIDQFLQDYNPKLYSIDNYFADIVAPLQLHQGTADTLVPFSWSDTFVSKMETQGKKVIYYKYRGNDHNLKQSWDLVVQRDIEFFWKNLK